MIVCIFLSIFKKLETDCLDNKLPEINNNNDDNNDNNNNNNNDNKDDDTFKSFWNSVGTKVGMEITTLLSGLLDDLADLVSQDLNRSFTRHVSRISVDVHVRTWKFFTAVSTAVKKHIATYYNPNEKDYNDCLYFFINIQKT